MNEILLSHGNVRLLVGDCIESMRSLASDSVHCCVTSPPYWNLRDYGHAGQIGLEKTVDDYVDKMVEVFEEVRRVLRPDGTLWLNLGDTYANASGGGAQGKTGQRANRRFTASGLPSKLSPGLKPKDLVGIPWRVAFALQEAGWWLRQDIIWSKLSPMPESVTDRCTKAHEYVFLLSKSERYYFDSEAIKEPVTGNSKIKHPSGWARGCGVKHDSISHNKSARSKSPEVVGTVEKRNKRSVWRISSKGYRGAHFATYPLKLVEPCILAGTSDAGCCAVCGAPQYRVTKSYRVATRPGTKSKLNALKSHPDSPYESHSSLVSGNRDPKRHVTQSKTVGFVPTCECDAGFVSCVVIDPFGGSGTTAAVAVELNRRAILCELNPEYAKLAIERVSEVQPQLF